MLSPPAPLAAASVPCAPNGLARVVAETGEGLRVVEPKVPELRPEDVLSQLNGHPLDTCAALEQALQEARQRALAVLVLIRRGSARQAVLIERWEDAPPTATPTPSEAPSTHTPTQSPLPVPTKLVPVPPPVVPAPVATAPAADPEAPVPPPEPPPAPTTEPHSDDARRSLLDALAFGRRLRAALPLSGSQQWAAELERVAAAHERRRAIDPAAAVVDPILSCYATALEIVAYKEEAVREADSPARRAATILEYASDSPVAAWLARFSFLSESVLEPPRTVKFIATAERPGRWQPDRAVELLVDRAIADAEALSVGRAP